jgi:hypothetical protein
VRNPSATTRGLGAMNRGRYAEQLSIENMLDRMGARVFASHPGCSLDTTLVKTGGRPRYIHRLGTHDEIWGLLRVTWEKKPDSDEQRPTAHNYNTDPQWSAVVDFIACPFQFGTTMRCSRVVDFKNASPSRIDGIDGDSCRPYCLATTLGLDD